MLSFNVDIIKLVKHPPELPIILSGLQQFYYLTSELLISQSYYDKTELVGGGL